jgi:hypothetical protein
VTSVVGANLRAAPHDDNGTGRRGDNVPDHWDNGAYDDTPDNYTNYTDYDDGQENDYRRYENDCEEREWYDNHWDDEDHTYLSSYSY